MERDIKKTTSIFSVSDGKSTKLLSKATITHSSKVSHPNAGLRREVAGEDKRSF